MSRLDSNYSSPYDLTSNCKRHADGWWMLHDVSRYNLAQLPHGTRHWRTLSPLRRQWANPLLYTSGQILRYPKSLAKKGQPKQPKLSDPELIGSSLHRSELIGKEANKRRSWHSFILFLWLIHEVILAIIVSTSNDVCIRCANFHRLTGHHVDLSFIQPAMAVWKRHFKTWTWHLQTMVDFPCCIPRRVLHEVEWSCLLHVVTSKLNFNTTSYLRCQWGIPRNWLVIAVLESTSKTVCRKWQGKAANKVADDSWN